jgi:transglutaminase-like putative cysteine protease
MKNAALIVGILMAGAILFGCVASAPNASSTRNATIPSNSTANSNSTTNPGVSCQYYPENASVSFTVRYGFNGTVYRGNISFVEPYPEQSTYAVSPPVDGGLSVVDTFSQADNRMLRFTINNTDGRYASLAGQVFIDMNGTGELRLLSDRNMSIREAAAGQPGYLGNETASDGRTLIDVSDPEIVAVAQQVKAKTGSDDAWTVARALFAWMMGNEDYYINESDANYVHLPAETLRSGKGKCDELSYLYVSMLRAEGIPARAVHWFWAERKTSPSDTYLWHVWVEFYDGEWVPVEVSSIGNADHKAGMYFGVQRPDHVVAFIDDGTDASMYTGDDYHYTYYNNQRPSISSYTHYDAVGHDPVYIAVCANGTRSLSSNRG